MVVLRPTVTTMGEVSRTAYAHAISEMRELIELTCERDERSASWDYAMQDTDTSRRHSPR